MRRSLGLVLALAGCAIAAPAEAQDARTGIAVLPFENGGSYGQDRESFDALSLGIAAMLASELGRNPGARLVERGRTAALVADQDLGAGARVDAGTAARIGKAAGARYMVMGTFIDFYGKFVVNARIVDAESGEILKVVSSGQKDRSQLFQMIRAAAAEIASAAGLPPAAASSRSVPTEALTAYSLGLLHEDRGDRAKAAEHYQRALATLPDYAEARDGLRRVRPT
jgi:TolB-like protein